MLLRRTFALLLLSCGLVFGVLPRPLAPVVINRPDLKKIDILKQYKGKVVLLVIMSTTCHDCQESVAWLNKLQEEFGSRGAQVVGAVGDTNAQYLLGPFEQRYRPKFPVGYLTKDEIIKIADVGPNVRPFVPIFMFIDKTSRVRFQYYGNDPFAHDAQKATFQIVSGLLNQR